MKERTLKKNEDRNSPSFKVNIILTSTINVECQQKTTCGCNDT